MTELNEHPDIEEEEDDDEFGDFEEATVSDEPQVQEPDDPFPETPTKNVNFGFAKFEDSPKLTPQRSFESPVSNMPSLQDLISDELFWDFEDPAASSMVEGDVDGIQYFEPFDNGSFSEDIDLPKVYLNSLKLWSEICFVEDTAALKFQWNKSKLYGGMLAALNMNSAKAAPRETVPLPMLVPTSPSPLQLDLPETRFKPKMLELISAMTHRIPNLSSSLNNNNITKELKNLQQLQQQHQIQQSNLHHQPLTSINQ